MAGIIKVVGIFLFLGLIARGNGQCSLSDLSVSQSQTGRTVQNMPEWSVSVTSNCPCVLLNVELNCKGFQTLEAIDPSTLRVSGDVCVVQNPISKQNPLNFRYAWDTSFPFTPTSSQIACS